MNLYTKVTIMSSDTYFFGPTIFFEKASYFLEEEMTLGTSPNAGPIIWSPTGRPQVPPLASPHGTTRAGSPARLTFTCSINTMLLVP